MKDSNSTADALSKVPAITGLFWLTKLVSTGMGESVSDFSSQIFGQVHQTMGELFTVTWSLAIFIICLYKQFSAKHYRPSYYWGAIAALAVFGTFSADTFKSLSGLHYLETTFIFEILTAIGFTSWYFSTRDLSIHHITSHRSEAFYWLTVAFSFMLGTAWGDWFATAKSGYNVDPTGLGLGFLNTGIILGLIFAGLLTYRYLAKPRENSAVEIITFWLAYILTRPVGASFADYLGYNFANGILGNQGMSAIWIIFFAICMLFTIKKFNANKSLELPKNA